MFNSFSDSIPEEVLKKPQIRYYDEDDYLSKEGMNIHGCKPEVYTWNLTYN